MNYKEVSQGVSGEEVTRYAKGIQSMNDRADSLQRQGELPERFSKIEPIATPEAPVEIKRFSQEALDFLKRKEQLVYPQWIIS